MNIIFNEYFHILTFNILGHNISYSISPLINKLKIIKLCQDGYMEFETNLGIESIDLFDEEYKMVTKKQKEKIVKQLKKLKLKNIKMKIE